MNPATENTEESHGLPESHHPMKVAVVGCGAVGSYYGARLAQAGHAVHFLLRSDYQVVKQDGVQILSEDGDFTVHPRCAQAASEIGECDLVLIALKTTANHCFAELLPPLGNSRTAFLTLQNGLGNEEQLNALFPAEQILGGLCFVCLNRIAPGTIRHMAHGLIVMGEFSGAATPRTRRIHQSFIRAGIPCRLTDDLMRTHWEKLVWNIPFNGLGLAASLGYEPVISGTVKTPVSPGDCWSTEALLSDKQWAALVKELMLEIIHSAAVRGMNIPATVADEQIERTRTMGPYRASTLLDFEKGLPLELDSIFLEPLRQAQEAGATVPRLEALCSVLRAIALQNQKKGRH